MGRYPHRLEKALIQSISQAIEKLPESEVVIHNRDSSVVQRIPMPQPDIVPDTAWKSALTQEERLFRLLITAAQKAGTYPTVSDPSMLLKRYGFHQHAPYIKKLENRGYIETIRGGGSNGRGLSEIKILEERPSFDKEKESVLVQLVKKGALDKGGKETPDVPTKKQGRAYSANNRTLALVDLENILIGLYDEGIKLDPQKLKNVCLNYGSSVGIRCFISEGTYQALEGEISSILSVTPVVLTSNGENAVDLHILEEARIAMRYNLADTFLLMTRDGGRPYEQFVDEARAAGKAVKLLVFSKKVSQDLVARIGNEHIASVTQSNARQSHFKQCVRNIQKVGMLVDIENADAKFIREIICILVLYMKKDNPPGFMGMYAMIWQNLRHETRYAYTETDCCYALEALVHIAQLVFYRTISSEARNQKSKRVYFLYDSHPFRRMFGV